MSVPDIQLPHTPPREHPPVPTKHLRTPAAAIGDQENPPKGVFPKLHIGHYEPSQETIDRALGVRFQTGRHVG